MVNKFPPLIYGALGAAAAYYGLSLAKVQIPLPAALCLLSLALFFAFFFPKPLAAFLLAGCVLGIIANARLPGLPALGLPEECVSGLSGTLLDDPRTSPGGAPLGRGGTARLKLERAYGQGALRVSARGSVNVYFAGEAVTRLKEFGRKSEIYVEGTFAEREGKGLFSSGLFSRGPFFIAAGTHITAPAPPLERLRSSARLFILKRLSSKKWGSLAAALLLGVRDNLDAGLAAAYRDAGLSHILALSGMHLGIISALIAFLLKKPLGLRPAAFLGAVIVTAYVYFVGPQPSLVRSLIMYLIGTAAVLGGAPEIKQWPLAVTAAAFIAQITLDPSSGLEISFGLSYAALAGILVLGGPLVRAVKGTLPDTGPAGCLLKALAASVGAFTASSPLAAAFFGTLRPIGILAGLVISPLTTLFMILSLVFLALGFVFPAAAFIAEIPLAVLYEAMEKTVSLASRFPGVRLSGFSGVGVPLGLSLAILLAQTCRERVRNRFEPFP